MKFIMQICWCMDLIVATQAEGRLVVTWVEACKCPNWYQNNLFINPCLVRVNCTQPKKHSCWRLLGPMVINSEFDNQIFGRNYTVSFIFQLWNIWFEIFLALKRSIIFYFDIKFSFVNGIAMVSKEQILNLLLLPNKCIDI